MFTAAHTKWKNSVTFGYMHQVRVMDNFMPVELRNHWGFCENLRSSGNVYLNSGAGFFFRIASAG